MLAALVIAWVMAPALYEMPPSFESVPPERAGAAAQLQAAYNGAVATTRASLIAGLAGLAALSGLAINVWSTREAEASRREELNQRDEDARERRITELYIDAAAQLGNTQAAVRLAGVYGLERLANNVPQQRQTIVNIICAYLRMPYSLQDAESDVTRYGKDIQTPRDPSHNAIAARQEGQVRTAAQQMLANHLRPTCEAFWKDIDINLEGANLSNLNFKGCHLRSATFADVTFTGQEVNFAEVTFAEFADFGGAQFAAPVNFKQAKFAKGAGFGRTTFGLAYFNSARFGDMAQFVQAEFAGSADFGGAQFEGVAFFFETRFDGILTMHTKSGDVAISAIFENAQFKSGITFAESRFSGVALFHEALAKPRKKFELPHGWKLDETKGADASGMLPIVPEGKGSHWRLDMAETL